MENRVINIGNSFPEFKKTAVFSLEAGKEFNTLTSEDHKSLQLGTGSGCN